MSRIIKRTSYDSSLLPLVINTASAVATMLKKSERRNRDNPREHFFMLSPPIDNIAQIKGAFAYK